VYIEIQVRNRVIQKKSSERAVVCSGAIVQDPVRKIQRVVRGESIVYRVRVVCRRAVAVWQREKECRENGRKCKREFQRKREQ